MSKISILKNDLNQWKAQYPSIKVNEVSSCAKLEPTQRNGGDFENKNLMHIKFLLL